MQTNAAVIGVGQSAYTRRPDPGQSTHTFIRDAVVAALRDAEIDAREIDGMALASFSLAPDAAVDVAWKLGLSLRWLVQDTNGGSSAMNMLGHALRGVETGAARNILVVGGDATGLGGYAKVAANFNIVTQLHLAPLGHGGPNGVYALVTSRQMKTYGLQKSDYGQLAIAQRAWAANNPYAVYRTPMTMEEYLAAPLVADPLSRYDCVPVVAARRPSSEPIPTYARALARRCACGRIAPASTTTIRRAMACRPASAPSPGSCGRPPACDRSTSTWRRSTTTTPPWCWRSSTTSA
jgi:acetyl-CoA acetyltransferase